MKKGIILLGLLGAAAILLGISFSAFQSASIGIIGGADGPTAIFVTGGFPWEWLLLIIGGLILWVTAGKKFKKKK